MSKIQFFDILHKKRVWVLHQSLQATRRVHFEIYVKHYNAPDTDFWHGMIENLHRLATIAFPSVRPVDHTPFSQTYPTVGRNLDLLPWLDDIVEVGSSMTIEDLLMMSRMNTDAALGMPHIPYSFDFDHEHNERIRLPADHRLNLGLQFQ